MKRFVAVATLQRGVLPRPKVLSDGDQADAFWQLRMDESQDLRVEFELATDDVRVAWSKTGAA